MKADWLIWGSSLCGGVQTEETGAQVEESVGGVLSTSESSNIREDKGPLLTEAEDLGRTFLFFLSALWQVSSGSFITVKKHKNH